MKLFENFEEYCDEGLLEEFEGLLNEYEAKDVKRVEDFFKKANLTVGEPVSAKIIALAKTMANRITNSEKAFNRAEAAKAVMRTKSGENNPVADIFYARASELGYDPDKIPVAIPKSKPITQDKTDQPKPKPTEVAKEPAKPVIKANIKIIHEPTGKPGSQLPADEQYSSGNAPRIIPGEDGAGTPVYPISLVDIAKGLCSIYDDPDNSIYDNWNGTVEVWKLNNDQHILVFTSKDVPTVDIGTDTPFINADTTKYLFYGEMVDYIGVQDMSALIEPYGNELPGYAYKLK